MSRAATSLRTPADVHADVRCLQIRLLKWLIDTACPLWSSEGVDRHRGGFHERLSGGHGLDEPRRARVQPRQIFALSNASSLGWSGDAGSVIARGLEYFIARFRRPDGLFRTLISADGQPIDDRAFLYDQAFALLGFSEAHRVLGPQSGVEDDARHLRETLYRRMKHAGGGFESEPSAGTTLSANATCTCSRLHWRGNGKATIHSGRSCATRSAIWRSRVSSIHTAAYCVRTSRRTGLLRQAKPAASSSPATYSSGPGCCVSGGVGNGFPCAARPHASST